MSEEVHPLRMQSGFFINYSYVLQEPGGNGAAVVDPAWEPGKLKGLLERLGVRLSDILLTHAHHDHVNLVPLLTESGEPDVFMSQAEIDFSGFRCKRLHALEDGDALMLRNRRVECLLTPGHTPGGMCFLTDGSLFTGDTLFIEGCGACALPGGSAEAMFDSVQRLKREIGDSVRVYPGHSFGRTPGQTFGFLRENNMYLQLEREHFISFRMRKHQKGLFHFR